MYPGRDGSGHCSSEVRSGHSNRAPCGICTSLRALPGPESRVVPKWSTVGYFSINPNWRNNWGANLEVNYGRNYELIYDPI